MTTRESILADNIAKLHAADALRKINTQGD